jgi:hypothetical protein
LLLHIVEAAAADSKQVSLPVRPDRVKAAIRTQCRVWKSSHSCGQTATYSSSAVAMYVSQLEPATADPAAATTAQTVLCVFTASSGLAGRMSCASRYSDCARWSVS